MQPHNCMLSLLLYQCACEKKNIVYIHIASLRSGGYWLENPRTGTECGALSWGFRHKTFGPGSLVRDCWHAGITARGKRRGFLTEMTTLGFCDGVFALGVIMLKRVVYEITQCQMSHAKFPLSNAPLCLPRFQKP